MGEWRDAYKRTQPPTAEEWMTQPQLDLKPRQIDKDIAGGAAAAKKKWMEQDHEPLTDPISHVRQAARLVGADVDLPAAKKSVGQCEKILKVLQGGQGIINGFAAMTSFNSIRIGARIFDLRHGKHDGTHYPIIGDGTPENPYRLES